MAVVVSYWWLRSPNDDNNAFNVNNDGNVNNDNVDNTNGVRADLLPKPVINFM